MKRLIALAFVAVLTLLTACEETRSGLIKGTGAIQSWGGECTGVWMVRADSGRMFELGSLAPEFQQRDLRVRFTLKPRNDRVSHCMVGEGAEVVAMAKL